MLVPVQATWGRSFTIAADRRRAVAQAGVVVRTVAVVALLDARVDEAVAAAGELAAARAAVAVVVVGIVALLPRGLGEAVAAAREQVAGGGATAGAVSLVLVVLAVVADLRRLEDPVAAARRLAGGGTGPEHVVGAAVVAELDASLDEAVAAGGDAAAQGAGAAIAVAVCAIITLLVIVRLDDRVAADVAIGVRLGAGQRSEGCEHGDPTDDDRSNVHRSTVSSVSAQVNACVAPGGAGGVARTASPRAGRASRRPSPRRLGRDDLAEQTRSR